jgi:hypothetical protein
MYDRSCLRSLRVLPLYHGPEVTICIGSTSRNEYKLSKALLCKQSPYFAATFEGNFKEGDSQSTILEEVDGVVTTRSFQMLVQWLYHHKVVFGESTPEETITTILEFVRLADMCGVSGMESLMAERIKSLILAANHAPEMFSTYKNTDTNPRCLTLQHITSAAFLPKGHPVRGVLAAAVVKEYFHYHDNRFMDKAEEYPDFSVDLLKAMKATFKSLGHNKRGITFKDSLSGEILALKQVSNSDSEYF